MHRLRIKWLFIAVLFLAPAESPTHALPEEYTLAAVVIDRTDINEDGVTDSTDLMLLLRNWGKGSRIPTPTSTPIPTPTETPEPILSMAMVDIPRGSFLMGNSGEGRDTLFTFSLSREQPRHEVTIDYSFRMGKFEVTNAEFAEVLNWALRKGYARGRYRDVPYNGGDVYASGGGTVIFTADGQASDIDYIEGQFVPVHRNGENLANHPVTGVKWWSAIAFCNWLSESEGRVPVYSLSFGTSTNRQAGGYRLPSESEWEYACRGSVSNPNRYKPFSFGDGPGLHLGSCDFNAILDQHMVWCGNTPSRSNGGRPFPVGSKAPNDFGLHDMHGSVWEWCEDRGFVDYSGAPADGSPWLTSNGSGRILRGGNWEATPWNCRSASRFWLSPAFSNHFTGFRVVRVEDH